MYIYNTHIYSLYEFAVMELIPNSKKYKQNIPILSKVCSSIIGLVIWNVWTNMFTTNLI